MRWLLAMGTILAACDDGGVVSPDAAVDAAIDAAPAQLALDPMTRSFGSVCLGDASFHDFSVANTGGPEPLSFRFIGTGAAELRIESTTCGALPVASSCTARVRFQPGSPGSKTANLEVRAPSGAFALANVDGTGASCSNLVVSPSSLAFGSVMVGSASTLLTATFKNTSSIVTFGALQTPTLAGADPGDFEITSDTCSGVSLGPSQECTIGARFQPTAAGGRSASVVVTANPGGTLELPLSGTGTL